MGQETFFKVGYAMLVATVAMMIYASLAASEIAPEDELHVSYPPCYFNPLCTCSKAIPDLGRVACENVPLSRIPRKINTSRVYALKLHNNGLRYIEPHFLEGTSLYRIEISRNNLSEIAPEAFSGLERTLRQIDLHSNRLTFIPSRSIRHLQKLNLLNLTDNGITDVAPENFRGVEGSLEVLVLRDNLISTLPAHVFSALLNLEVVDLSGNSLLDLNPNTFHDGPPRLTKLYLQDNAINTFPYQQLTALKMLQYLDLSRNRISQMQVVQEEGRSTKVSLNLDVLRLDYNQIQFLPSRAFENFRTINSTHLDGNPISVIQMDAFQGTKMKQLYLRDCGIAEFAPGAFSGLEPTLTLLDLTGNNITSIPHRMFDQFDVIKRVSFKNNPIRGLNTLDSFSGFQYSLNHLDLSGSENGMTTIQDLRQMRNLRSLSLSRLPHESLRPEDFFEFGGDLRELKISHGNLKGIQNHAFKNLQSLEKLDLSENSITSIDNDAFAEVGDSLVYLNLAAAFSSAMGKLPNEAFRHLTAIERLDVSNNKVRTMPETSFHSMKNLHALHMEDNLIETVVKGTFQAETHSHLEKIFLSFNQISSIHTQTFVDLRRLDTLRLDDNRLNRIDKRAFMNLDKLKYLNLRGNKINQISEEAFQNLPELQDLDLAYNDLKRFDFSCLDQVGTLSSFRVNVSHNTLRQLESNVTQYVTDSGRGGVVHTNIEELDFSHNNITNIGRWYFRPVESSLTHLYLSHNSLRNVSKDLLGSMRHLQWLDLSHNQIEELEFDSFRALQSLQVLYLQNNQLLQLPDSLFKGLGLRVVNLSYNRLRNLPDITFQERGLENLYLAGNQLARVPTASLSPDAAPSLVELDLSSNAIVSLHSPDAFSRFAALQRLDLSHNLLMRVDEGAFSQMPLLSVLDLSGNLDLILDSRGMAFHGIGHSLHELYLRNLSLYVIPEMHLPALRLLDLSNNKISMVPDDLATNLTSLRTLLVGGNGLDAVPFSLSKFTQLRSLSLARNPLYTLTFPQGLLLRELDVRQLPLEGFEFGTLGKIPTLSTLRVSPSSSGRGMNLPILLQDNYALQVLHIEAHIPTPSTLDHELNGPLPLRLNRIEVSGRGVKSLGNNFLQGVRSPILTLVVHNTSIEKIPRTVFQHARHVRTLRLDVRSNTLKVLGNPNTAGQPGTARKTFLMDLKIAGNRWTCDCELGWIEGWERKRRQYFCTETWDSCKTNEDDLREAFCENKRHQRVLDVLKSDVECGWNKAASLNNPIITAVLSLVAIYLTRTT